jgi:hypothetical protein
MSTTVVDWIDGVRGMNTDTVGQQNMLSINLGDPPT